MHYLILPTTNIPAAPSQNYPVAPLLITTCTYSCHALRFTESYGVIFQCNVKYCLGPCEPVSLSIYLYICMFLCIYLSMHLFIYKSIIALIHTYLSNCLHIYPKRYLFIYAFIYLLIYKSFDPYLPIYLSTYLSKKASIYQ